MSAYDTIPELLVDKTTILEKGGAQWLPPSHTQFTYLFCVLLRIIIGILIYQNVLSSNFVIILVLIILIVFGSKYYNIVKNRKSLWKNYQRHVISYSIVLITQLFNLPDKEKISGIIIILDALLGQQSRFITTNMSRNSPN